MAVLQRLLVLLFAVPAFLVSGVVPAPAQGGGPAMGSLATVLPPTGQDDNWRFATTANGFEIENIGDRQAIKYFFAGSDGSTDGRRTIETFVSIHPASTGSAGLLYGLNDARDRYHLVTLGGGGVVTVFRRDGSGFRPLIEQSSSSFRSGEKNRLTIEENGNEISFALNGDRLGTISGELFGNGRVGIAAVGYVFAKFGSYSDGVTMRRSEVVPDPERPGDTRPDGTLQVQPVQIVDAQGPAGQMVAYQTLIPKGWVPKGGVVWSPQDGRTGCFTGARLIWGAGLEDETYGLSFLDPISWGMSSDGPSRYMCVPQDLTDAEAAMRSYFQIVSNAIKVDIKDVQRPPEIRPLVEAVARGWAQAWAQIPSARTWADGVVITADISSQTSRKDSYIVAITKHVEVSYGQTTFRDGRTALVIAGVTPPGKLAEGHPGFGVVLNNLRVNPQWQRIEAQWWADRLRAGRQQTQAAAADSSVGDMMFESWKRRQAMQDAGHSATINGIWEVQPWRTPGGNTVLLNQNYNYAWQLQNGEIVLTNNANYNPMQNANQHGQQLTQGY